MTTSCSRSGAALRVSGLRSRRRSSAAGSRSSSGRHGVGGVCTNTGTVPSKTLRAAALDLTGLQQKDMYGDAYRVKSQITIEDLFWRTRRVIDRETEVIRDQLSRNHVDLLTGTARFIDEHTLDLGPEAATGA